MTTTGTPCAPGAEKSACRLELEFIAEKLRAMAKGDADHGHELRKLAFKIERLALEVRR